MRTKPRKSWAWAAFPKQQRVKRALPKAIESEKSLQAKTNAILDAMGLEYLRLSSDLYRCVFANPTIPVHIKKFISDQIKGWPDNMVFIPIDNKYNLSLCIELKTSIGKQSAKQKELAKSISIQVLRSEEEVRGAIADAEAIAGKIKGMLEI